MKLSKKLAEIFEEEFETVFQKEKADKDYLSQDQFLSCKSRAQEAIDVATEKVVNALALSIAVHREEEHGEDTAQEQAELLDAGADPEIGTYGFWSQ